MVSLNFLDNPLKLEDLTDQPKRPWHKENTLIHYDTMRLYLEGVKEAEIARRLKISRMTVWIWVKKGGWEWRKQQIIRETRQQVYDSVKEMKERHLKIARAIQRLMIQQLNAGTLKITISDGLKAMEYETRLSISEL